MKKLPNVVGPGLLSRVLRDAVQGLVDSAQQAKQTFSVLRNRQGDGDAVIRGIVSTFTARSRMIKHDSKRFSQIRQSSAHTSFATGGHDGRLRNLSGTFERRS